MRICYLSEGTPLCGGVKVMFEQAEALQERGHQVEVISKGKRPDWYALKVPFRQVHEFFPSTLPECDFLVGTFWPTVRAAVEAGKGRPVHLCQGYEGDTPAYEDQRPAIEAVYRLPTVMLTVHEPLTQLVLTDLARTLTRSDKGSIMPFSLPTTARSAMRFLEFSLWGYMKMTVRVLLTASRLFDPLKE